MLSQIKLKIQHHIHHTRTLKTTEKQPTFLFFDCLERQNRWHIKVHYENIALLGLLRLYNLQPPQSPQRASPCIQAHNVRLFTKRFIFRSERIAMPPLHPPHRHIGINVLNQLNSPSQSHRRLNLNNMSEKTLLW